MTEPLPLIEVSGSAFARGVSYGTQARERIHVGIGHYSAQLRRLSLGAAGLGELVRRYLPVMEAFEPLYVEEMRGIAKGAGVSFDEVVLLNARTELVKLAERGQAKPAPQEPADGCTGVIVLPEAARDGRLIHALNWDWKLECLDSTVVLRLRRDDGPDVLTMTEAGALGRAGMNSAGVGLTGNYLECDRDYSQVGVPIALVRRKALEAEHVAMAMHTVHVTPKSASSNMMVSHAAGIGIDFECAPDETFQLYPDNGLLVHANHWVSVPARAKLVEKGVAAMPDSLYRDWLVAARLRPAIGSIAVDDVKAALLDDRLSPWSVCRPARLNPAGVMTATVATVVMQPALGTLEIAVNPAAGNPFTTYRFADAPGGAAGSLKA